MTEENVEQLEEKVESVEADDKDTSEEPAVESEPTEEQPIAAEGEAKEPAHYEPNLSFKVHDEEKSFDEWVKPAITNKEVEEQVRELYEKAYGLDVVKPKLAKAREEYEQLQEQYNPLAQGIDQLKQHVANKDFDSFFKGVNIPQEWVYKWVVEKMNYQNMSPEDKQKYDSSIESRRETSQLRQENEYYQQQVESVMVNQRESELNNELSKPEVNSLMQEFDSKMGRVGAFREEIIKRARAEYDVSGRDISAQEAVGGLLALMGKAATAGGNQQVAQGQSPQSQGANQRAKPVIPNIQGRGTSPVKKVARSLDDLRALEQGME